MAIEDIVERLEALDIGKMREAALADIRSGKKTKRKSGVKLLRAVDGLQRSGVSPKDLVVTKVPVIPADFRPYTMAGETFVPGDANELYSDLIKGVKVHRDSEEVFGAGNSPGTEDYVRNAVRAVYGHGESPNPKIKARGVSGFLEKILGTNPKTSFVQSRLLAKPQDFVGRGVITPDPDLGMDEAGIPEDMAWNIFDTHVRRNLAARGIPASRALQMIQERGPIAKQALDAAMKENPVLMSRAPAWHHHNLLSAYGKVVDGHTVRISPYITAGYGADFDGDTMSLHAPVLPDAKKDAKEKMLPSQLLFSVRSRDKTLPVPKHEMVLGLASSQLNPSGVIHKFRTADEALSAIQSEAVKLQDRVVITG